MDERVKQRLVGALVLTALAVIFLPMLFESRDRDIAPWSEAVPPRPLPEDAFQQPPRPAPPPEPVAEATDGESASAAEGAVRAWAVQVGSFTQRDNAVALRDDLKNKEFPAFIVEARENSQAVYRVRIGPNAVRSDAEALARRMQAEHDLSALVVRFP